MKPAFGHRSSRVGSVSTVRLTALVGVMMFREVRPRLVRAVRSSLFS